MTFAELVDFLIGIVSPLVPIIVSLSVIAFVWGVIQVIINSDNAEKVRQGRSFMVWGVVALFVMISVWGLVSLVSGTFFSEGDLDPVDVSDLLR